MPIMVLKPEEALSGGADLWIIPDPSTSNWTNKIDWYLNFQICNSARLKPPTNSDFLTQTLQETGIERREFGVDIEAPFMIASHDLLPNKWVVILPWKHNLTAWVSKSFEIWNNLKNPGLRLFLPPGQSAGALEREWKLNDQSQELTVVLD